MKTVKVSDDLHRKVKTRAALRGYPIEWLTEAALLMFLEEDGKRMKKPEVQRAEKRGGK